LFVIKQQFIKYLLREQVNKLAIKSYKQLNYKYILLNIIANNFDNNFTYLNFDIKKYRFKINIILNILNNLLNLLDSNRETITQLFIYKEFNIS